VDEHGASATGHPRSGIVVDLDDEIIEVVGAAQTITGNIGRAMNRAIIEAMTGILTPGIVGADPANRQQCPWPGRAIGPPP
jgi:hypothetical protein